MLQITFAIATAASVMSCTKGIKQPVTFDNIVGKWDINAIRYQIFQGSETPKDSTVSGHPAPENFVKFDGVSNLQYCFNSSSVSGGTYFFVGQDSIRISVGSENTRWKILLLTPSNFNIERTSTDNHISPGVTIITYQSFTR